MCGMNFRWRLGSAAFVLAMASAALPAPNDVVVWNQALCEAVKSSKLGPPATARAIALVHTAMYDAWCCFSPQKTPITPSPAERKNSECTEANRRNAVNCAAYRMMVNLFPERELQLTMTLYSLGYTRHSSNEANSEGMGVKCAEILAAARIGDGSNQAASYSDTTAYTTPNSVDVVKDPSVWQPLKFSNGAIPGYLYPHWGEVKPFSLEKGSSLRPPAPPKYGSPEYVKEMVEVIDLTARLDDRQKVIAEYWAGGPGTVQPPGMWCEIAAFISKRDKHTLDQDVVMFAMLGNALMDAGIACWDAKRAYNTSRPITAVRNLYRSQKVYGWRRVGEPRTKILGADWLPYQPLSFVTPPFPEYVSGHSTFSAAAAEVLRQFTGSDKLGMSTVFKAGTSHTDVKTPAKDVVLTWPTLTSAAEEAGYSRLLGGIHFRSANLEGQKLGTEIGKRVVLKINRLLYSAE